MPKVLEANLYEISCETNRSGGSIKLAGNIFGALFQNDPEDPNDEVSRLPLPFSPIEISQGERKQIKMQSPAFTIGDETENDLHYLKIGGEINNGLGSNFFTVDTRTPIVQCLIDPGFTEFDLAYSTPNLQITLYFSLCVNIGF